MRVNAFPFWLTFTRITLSTRPTVSKALHFGNPLQTSRSSRGVNLIKKSSSGKLQNSFETMAFTDMERGVGGRIEAAFEAAKNKGEAAFITFITAGYPNPQGRSIYGFRCPRYA
jgi:hypothetical protein